MRSSWLTDQWDWSGHTVTEFHRCHLPSHNLITADVVKPARHAVDHSVNCPQWRARPADHRADRPTLESVDATNIYLAADQINGCAAELRARADLVRLRMQQTNWHSTAAVAAFDRVQELIAMLLTGATRVEAVAEATRQLAVKIAFS